MRSASITLLPVAFLMVPFAVSAQVVINEIAWPVESAYAADHGLKMGTMIISEVAWMGSPVEGVDAKQWWRYEWVELYNNSEVLVPLDGWAIELSRPASVPSDSRGTRAGKENIDFKIPLSGAVSANSYFLIGASDKILNLDINYKNLGGKFFNGGQKVVLKNNLGEVIDDVDAVSGWPAGDNKTKQTMERVQGRDPCAQGSLPCIKWQTSKESGGTPKAPNSKGYQPLSQKVENTSDSSYISLLKESAQTEKDVAGHSTFQSRIPIVNPIALLAGFLALGFSGVLLLVKRSLALRQSRRT